MFDQMSELLRRELAENLKIPDHVKFHLTSAHKKI